MEISRHRASILLDLARKRITDHLFSRTTDYPPGDDPYYRQPLATFVTLTLDGQLRGCIGNLTPTGPLWESVADNAVNAAFHDQRFSPLSEDELDMVHIEISILTPPRVLEYTDSADLAARLRPGVDGVILRRGRAGATFLPQVWRQLPSVELFLGHLCRKAGLPENCWKNEHLDIQTYQVEHFHEEQP